MAAASSADTPKNDSCGDTSCHFVSVQFSLILPEWAELRTHGVSPQEDVQRVGGVQQLELHEEDKLQRLNAERCGAEADGVRLTPARTDQLSELLLTFCNDLLVDRLDSFRTRVPHGDVGAQLTPGTHRHTHRPSEKRW